MWFPPFFNSSFHTILIDSVIYLVYYILQQYYLNIFFVKYISNRKEKIANANL